MKTRLGNQALVLISVMLGQALATLIATEKRGGQGGSTGSQENGTNPAAWNPNAGYAEGQIILMAVERSGNASSAGEVDVLKNGQRISVVGKLADFVFAETRARVGDVLGFWSSPADRDAGGIAIVLKKSRVYWRSGEENGLKCAWGLHRDGDWSWRDYSSCSWDVAVIARDSESSGIYGNGNSNGVMMKGAQMVWARDAPAFSSVACRLVVGGEVCPRNN